MTADMGSRSEFVKPEVVAEYFPGLTTGNLAQLRFRGEGPKYYKPTPRVVLYRLDEVVAWVEGTARMGTSDLASAPFGGSE